MKTIITDALLPLPHEIEVSDTVRIASDSLQFVTPPGASDMLTAAVADLRAVCRNGSDGCATGKTFTIYVGRLAAMSELDAQVVGEAGRRLRTTPNPDQAYVIRPLGTNGLMVAGLDDKGVFYGIQTLRQMLIAGLTDRALIIPLATITDWPDFAERGLWNSGLRRPADTAWLAGWKMNFEHINHPVDFRPDAPRCPPLPMDIIEAARTKAFHIMPHCWHYDFWSESPDLPEYYPELIGKRETARNPSSVSNPAYHPAARCPCTAGPTLKNLLAEWIRSAAEQGMREVSLWLTEYQPCRCGCEVCAKEPRHQLIRETRESIRAIQEARERYPDMLGRLFLTFNQAGAEEERACLECLAMLPDDGSIRVECVYGLQQPFDEIAKAGHWVANYGLAEPLGGSWGSRGATRFRLYPDPEGLRERIRYLKNAGYRAVYNASSVIAGGDDKGSVERHLCEFHIAMLAEWCWNANGRDVDQLIRAWLRQRGCADVPAMMSWARDLLPLERLAFQALEALPAICRAIGSREDLLNLPGLESFPDDAGIEAMIGTARRCADTATAAGEGDMAAESRCLAAALGMVRGIRRLCQTPETSDAATGRKLKESLEEVSGMIDAMLDAADDQTAAWTALDPSTAAALNEFTRSYWKTRETGLRSAIESLDA